MAEVTTALTFDRSPRDAAPAFLRHFAIGIRRRAAAPALLLVLGIVSYQLYQVSLTPGEIIRQELAAAAATLPALAWNAPADTVQQRLTRHFTPGSATIDLAGYPARVAVTLHDIDRATCVDARNQARRIEDSVVVDLVGYAAPDACAAHNEMTWQLQP
jgi:hypothetical protein